MRKLDIGIKTETDSEVTLTIDTGVDRHGLLRMAIITTENCKGKKPNIMDRVRCKKELGVGEESAKVENMVAFDLLAEMTIICSERKGKASASKIGSLLSKSINKVIKQNNLEIYTNGVGNEPQHEQK